MSDPLWNMRDYFNRDNDYSIKERDLTLRAKLSKTNRQYIFQLKYIFILPAMDRTPRNTVFLSNCSYRNFRSQTGSVDSNNDNWDSFVVKLKNYNC